MDSEYDIFLNYSSKDLDRVRSLAERLRHDGVKVWFDLWCIEPGDRYRAKMLDGVTKSRLIAVCWSRNNAESRWADFEREVLLTDDPLNEQRRLIPLLFDDHPLSPALRMFSALGWRPSEEEASYPRLLARCRGQSISDATPAQSRVPAVGSYDDGIAPVSAVVRDARDVECYAFSGDGKSVVVPSRKGALHRVSLPQGRRTGRVFRGHEAAVNCAAFSPDGKRLVSGSNDETLRVWEFESAKCLRVLRGHTSPVAAAAWSANGRHVLSGSDDRTACLWDAATGDPIRTMDADTEVWAVALADDATTAFLAGHDGKLRIANLATGKLKTLKGHERPVRALAWSSPRQQVVSGSYDGTLRIWDPATSRCVAVLRGHTGSVLCAAWNRDGRFIVSGATSADGADFTVRLWDARTAECLAVFDEHQAAVWTVAWSSDEQSILSGDQNGRIYRRPVPASSS